MGKDVKIGLALGLVVIITAIVIFSVSGGGDQAPEPDDTPDAAAPSDPDDASGGPDDDPGDVVIEPGPGPGPDLDPGLTPGIRPDSDDLAADTVGRTILVHHPEPPATGTRTATHVVVAGDTLWGLAKRYYGEPKRLREIQQANRDRLPTVDSPLRIGMRLTIPGVPADRDAPHDAGAAVDHGSTGDDGTASAGSENAYDVYTVRAGDTLNLIALRFYGAEGMSRRIVEANPRLRRDPNHIGVGWKLRIPRQPAGERTAARDID